MDNKWQSYVRAQSIECLCVQWSVNGMCACLCVYVRVSVSVRVCVCVCVYLSIRMRVCACICLQISYIIFLVIYIYTVLVRSLSMPEWNEWYVVVYMVSLALEKLREVPSSLLQPPQLPFCFIICRNSLKILTLFTCQLSLLFISPILDLDCHFPGVFFSQLCPGFTHW